MYPIGDEAKLRDPEHIMHRAILTPKNSGVHDINNAVMQLFPRTYDITRVAPYVILDT